LSFPADQLDRVSASKLQAQVLRRKTREEYELYRAALEWDLTEPIVIDTPEDLKSEHRWREHLTPYTHQVTNLMTFCRRLPVTLLADDVGLGKTISAGLIASELIARSRLQSLLIVCPKLLGPQWQDELQSKFNIAAQIAIGQELIEAETSGVGAIITTYASARLHLEKIPAERFQMLILDEAHKLRNLYGVDPPPQVAVRFREALESRRFRYVLMLTATPIHNRLWDLYSLVELLTVARGHQNPFGSEGMFVRRFVADKRDEARHLKPEARDEFRAIVYGYMSRVRRADAKLAFPDRVVHLHRVQPTRGELRLIQLIAEPIQKLNRLAQISILQALTSSPHALMSQLNTMARNRTVPAELAEAVRALVVSMPITAKLQGLGALIERLRRENPEGWRVVVFTGRLETQTTIQAYLEERGLQVGIINGASGQRNQETLAEFRRSPPPCHVIVSTEAGAEGVNLQVANVLVNYDLPWNPMIVEQRIGRVQRLVSEHARVSILNIILAGTFEEYIVGRLMEKLQMAAHAIGDIEALLEASGIDEEDTEQGSFDEQIRKLVIAALAGRDVEAATRQMEENIAQAKTQLESERAQVDALLGGMTGAHYVGPRSPKLPPNPHSMEAEPFARAALASLGVHLSEHRPGVYLAEEGDRREFIRFAQDTESPVHSSVYAEGTPAFARLVDRIVSSGAHQVSDVDRNPVLAAKTAARRWAQGFGATPSLEEIKEVRRCFDGTALVRVRATVAHDSYERLVDVRCRPPAHGHNTGPEGLRALDTVIERAEDLGLSAEAIDAAAQEDSGIAEFCRFYLERRAQEMAAAGGDERKRKRLEDEFTPRLEFTMVGVEGKLYRELAVAAHYTLGDSKTYTSMIRVQPHSGSILSAPELGRCARSGKQLPVESLGRCEISGQKVIESFLVRSDLSGRTALAEHTERCALSGKRALSDELEVSETSRRRIASTLLRTSQVSGRRAEPEYFGRCEFTGVEALQSELGVSQVSHKRYRIDQQERSCVSGKTAHRDEFIECRESRQLILPQEAERCEITGSLVRPGILQRCGITQKSVLPGELERCATTGVRALKTLLVASSLSGVRLLEREAIRSQAGQFCAPSEAKRCIWSGQLCHPDDMTEDCLTGLPVQRTFVTSRSRPQLQPLADLLQGVRRNQDNVADWPAIASRASTALGGPRCQVEAARASPDHRHLAVVVEVKKLLGLHVRYAGLLYSIDEQGIVGRIALGRRTSSDWSATPE
jgi:superfamily II DNA or RNA helicase